MITVDSVRNGAAKLIALRIREAEEAKQNKLVATQELKEDASALRRVSATKYAERIARKLAEAKAIEDEVNAQHDAFVEALGRLDDGLTQMADDKIQAIIDSVPDGELGERPGGMGRAKQIASVFVSAHIQAYDAQIAELEAKKMSISNLGIEILNTPDETLDTLLNE